MSIVQHRGPMTPALVRNWLSSGNEAAMVVRRGDDSATIVVRRLSPESAFIEFPSSPPTPTLPFAIQPALQSAGLLSHLHDEIIRVRANDLAQLWTTLKLAYNHLQWYDDRDITCSFE